MNIAEVTLGRQGIWRVITQFPSPSMFDRGQGASGGRPPEVVHALRPDHRHDSLGIAVY